MRTKNNLFRYGSLISSGLGGLLILWALAGLGSFLDPSSARAQRPTSEVIKVGYLPVNVMTAIYAKAIDAWREEGLNVELELFRSGPYIVEAMQAGSIQAGDIGYMPMMFAARRGIPFIFLTSDGIATREYPANRIMVRRDSDIKDFRGLRGKTITTAAKGTVEDVLISAAAKYYDVPREEIKQVFIPFPQMPQVLQMKQVDAIYVYPPADTVTELLGIGKTLVDSTDFMPYFVISGLAVVRKWAEDNPEATVRLSKGWIKTGRWINDNPEKARKVAEKMLELKPEVAQNMRIPYWPRNGLHLMPGVWDLYHLMVDTKQISPVEDPRKFIDRYWAEPTLKYVLPALKGLGTQDDPVVRQILKMKLPYLGRDPKDYLASWEK